MQFSEPGVGNRATFYQWVRRSLEKKNNLNAKSKVQIQTWILLTYAGAGWETIPSFGHFSLLTLYTLFSRIRLNMRRRKAILSLIKCGKMSKYFNHAKTGKKPKRQWMSLSKADMQFLTKREKKWWRRDIREELLTNSEDSPPGEWLLVASPTFVSSPIAP